ncbi:MAG TPA: hypothetical protein VJH70_01690 [Candidatus Paceibacterota bacterium]
MSFRTSLFIFFGLLLIGLGSYFTVHNGWYPVAIIDFKFVSASTLEKDYQAAAHYFTNALLTYGANKTNQNVLKEESTKQEIRRSALEKIVIDAIIFKEAQKEFGDNLDVRVENLISKNVQLNNLAEAADTLYGMTLEEFKERIVVTQARRELLEERKLTEKTDFKEWLKGVSQNSKVIILVPYLKWNGSGIEITSS